jgi:N-acetylneuraminic acid mutarotase
LGIWALLGFVVLSLVVIVRMATGVGPNLPGAELGLVDDPTTYEYCTPEPSLIETPTTPPPPDGRWREEPALPAPRDELKAVTLDGRILIANGHGLTEDDQAISQSIVQAFDPASDSYEGVTDSPLPLDHAVAAAYRGDLYLVGGFSNGEPQDRLWRYSSDTGEWDELASMQTARYAPAGAVVGDKLYVAGGSTGELETPYRSMEVYDFETGEWQAGPDMPTPRHHVSGAALDGQLYVIGGRRPGDFAIDAVERFDPQAGVWKQLPPLPQGTGGNAAVAANGELVVVAGGDDMGYDGGGTWVTPSVWAFDPQRAKWRRLPDLPVPRHGHAATVADGRIYVFGGSPCPGFGQTDSVVSLSAR